MRTAKYNDYRLISISMFIVMVILVLAIYFLFMAPSQEHSAGDDAWVTVDPTCDADGYRYKVCTDCGETFSQETIPATGHTNFNTVKENEKDHTLTVGGSYESVVYCADCGAEISRETVWVGHEHTPEIVVIDENVVEPTCEEPGSKEVVKICAGCDEEISRETVTIDPLGHDYEWTADYDKDTKTYSLNGVCGIDGSEISIDQNDSDVDFNVVGDETVASCCLIRYIVSCTFNGKKVQAFYDCTPHDNHTVEYYEDEDLIYDPTPTYLVLPDPSIDPKYGQYYNIDDISGIKSYDIGNSVWDENGFSYGVFKCYACEEHGCTACAEYGYRFIVRIYSAEYDTRLDKDENTEI